MTPAEVLARARSQIGHGTTYALGKGGYFPNQLTAANALGECDCSGFVAWSLDSPRQVELPAYRAELGEWCSTAAMVRDAQKSASGMFALIPWDQAIPSDVFVWAGDPVGHCGIISEVKDGKPSKVIHCSSGNWRNFKDAIQETDAHIFIANHAIVARCHHVEAE